MKAFRLVVAVLVMQFALFAQTPVPAKPKHPKWHKLTAKVKRDAKIGAEVAGGVVIVGLLVVGSGGAAVKVY